MSHVLDWKRNHFTYFRKTLDRAIAPGNNIVTDEEMESLKKDPDFIAAAKFGAIAVVPTKAAPMKRTVPANLAGKGEPVERKISDNDLIAAIADMFDLDALEAISLDEKNSAKVQDAAKLQIETILAKKPE